MNNWFWLSGSYSLLLNIRLNNEIVISTNHRILSHTASVSVANRSDLWTHILFFKDLLILDNFIDAENEDELANTVPEH